MDFIMKGWVFCLVLSGLCVSDRAAEKSQVDADPVEVGVYYGSKCQGCIQIFETQLGHAFSAVGEIMNLTLVPYGNAQESYQGGRWVFNCVYGEDECTGNMIQTCAIHFLMNVTEQFPFIQCIMTNQNGTRLQVAKQCASNLTELNRLRIKDCYRGDLGNTLEHGMALRTQALNASESAAPWVTINGNQTEYIQTQAQVDLVLLICDAYQGSKPDACKEEEDALMSV